MTIITKAGFVAIASDVIYAVGETEDAAWAAACQAGPFSDANGNDITDEEARDTQFIFFPATAALIAKVEAEGGAISFSIVKDTACLRDEGRKAVLAALESGAEKGELEAFFAEMRNVTCAEIDAEDGGVWIEGVQGDRWLRDDEITSIAMEL